MNMMNGYFVAAAAIVFVVGLVHSVFGEILVFRRMRQRGVIPTNGGHVLGEGHVRILWASWHIVTVFGWCIGAVLWRLALPSAAQNLTEFEAQSFAIAALAASILVFVGTKARHPGWAGLLAIAVCAWLGGT